MRRTTGQAASPFRRVRAQGWHRRDGQRQASSGAAQSDSNILPRLVDEWHQQALIGAQRLNGIDPRRASRRQIRGERADGEQHETGAAERNRIRWTHLE